MSRRNKVVLAVMILAGIIIFGFSLRNVNLNQMARDVVHSEYVVATCSFGMHCAIPRVRSSSYQNVEFKATGIVYHGGMLSEFH
jgi:hypothetical protein